MCQRNPAQQTCLDRKIAARHSRCFPGPGYIASIDNKLSSETMLPKLRFAKDGGVHSPPRNPASGHNDQIRPRLGEVETLPAARVARETSSCCEQATPRTRRPPFSVMAVIETCDRRLSTVVSREVGPDRMETSNNRADQTCHTLLHLRL